MDLVLEEFNEILGKSPLYTKQDFLKMQVLNVFNAYHEISRIKYSSENRLEKLKPYYYLAAHFLELLDKFPFNLENFSFYLQEKDEPKRKEQLELLSHTKFGRYLKDWA
jgi:hypothetical protein